MDTLFCYHIVLMLVATVAFTLLAVGFSTPGWMAVTFQESTAATEWTVSSLNRSLWYDVHCPQELKTCKSCDYSDSDQCVIDMGYPAYTNHITWIEQLTEDKAEWMVWRVIMTVVVGFALIGYVLVISLVCCILRTYVYKIIAICGFVLWLIAGLLVWVPVGMNADMHLDVDDTVDNDITHDATLHVPYSVVITAFGGFLGLVTALMLLWLTGLCRRSEESESGSSSGEVFSDRSKIQSSTIVRDDRYIGPYGHYAQDRPMVYREQQVPYTEVQEQGHVVDSYHTGYPLYGGYKGYPFYDNPVRGNNKNSS